MEDKLYSFVMRGELTKVALQNAGALNRHSVSDERIQKYIESLSWDLMDNELVNSSRLMSAVYIAISSFENTVRRFVTKILLENKGENWWEECVSDKIRTKAESRKKEDEKIRWHTPRGDSLINYTEFGDLASIMSQNIEYFQDHIISVDWARQIFHTLERSRNVIMHSGELGRRDVERIGTNIRDWLNQVGA